MDMTSFGYRATRAEDGTLTIHHVPIFVECSRGKVDFDADWIEAAVEKAKEAEAEGYLPPLHVRHHEDGPTLTDPVRAAGFFRITGAESIQFKGKRRLAVFADLVITDPSVSMDVLAKRLPYRSVEIFDVDLPALDSLALLDHEAPYLELPMLLVAAVDDAKAAGQKTFRSESFENPWRSRSATLHREPLVACFRRGQSAHLITEDPMGTELAEKTKKKTAADKEETPNGEKLKGATGKAGGDQGDGGDDKAEKMAAGVDIDAILKAIADGSLDADALLKALAATRTEKDEEGEDTSKPAKAMVPSEAMSHHLRKIATENEKLKASQRDMAARLDERDKADKRAADVAIAMKRLEGRPLGAELHKELVKFHTEHGPKAFAAHVDAMVGKFAALPAFSDYALHAFADQPDPHSGESDAVYAYMEAGTEAVQKAARFSAEWRLLKDKGGTRLTEERYVELSMQRAGHHLKKKKRA